VSVELRGFGELDLAASGLLAAAEAASEAELPQAAERLSVNALELCLGTELSHRLVTLWRRGWVNAEPRSPRWPARPARVTPGFR
jgi:hypothetical protein